MFKNIFSDYDPSKYFNLVENSELFMNYIKTNQELFFSFYENMYKNVNEISKKNKVAYDELLKTVQELSKENPTNTKEILNKSKIILDTLMDQNENLLKSTNKSREDAYEIIKNRTSDMFSNISDLVSKKEKTTA